MSAEAIGVVLAFVTLVVLVLGQAVLLAWHLRGHVAGAIRQEREVSDQVYARRDAVAAIQAEIKGIRRDLDEILRLMRRSSSPPGK